MQVLMARVLPSLDMAGDTQTHCVYDDGRMEATRARVYPGKILTRACSTDNARTAQPDCMYIHVRLGGVSGVRWTSSSSVVPASPHDPQTARPDSCGSW